MKIFKEIIKIFHTENLRFLERKSRFSQRKSKFSQRKSLRKSIRKSLRNYPIAASGFLKHSARNRPNFRLRFLSASLYVPGWPCKLHVCILVGQMFGFNVCLAYADDATVRMCNVWIGSIWKNTKIQSLPPPISSHVQIYAHTNIPRSCIQWTGGSIRMILLTISKTGQNPLLHR